MRDVCRPEIAVRTGRRCVRTVGLLKISPLMRMEWNEIRDGEYGEVGMRNGMVRVVFVWMPVVVSERN